MTKTIYLDPGHGGNDPGAVLGDRYEKDDNLRMAIAVRDKLRERGHTVIMSRDPAGDANPALEDRIAGAVAAKADIFLSLHRNSYGTPGACGVEIWVRYPNHAAAAGEVLEQLMQLPHQINRGVKLGNYRVLAGATMPAMLLELGFLSNLQDNKIFDLYFDEYATAIARGALAALGEGWEAGRPGGAQKPLYRVQVGAFESREYAEAFLQYVRKEKGLPAFLIAPGQAPEEAA
jgi:N-acetylmuramoyl-L-alanine amidase